MNYYQFHVGDYVSHTAHLDPIEDLAFRRLLDLYYQSESPIPNETKMVSKRIRLGSYEEQVISVLSEFFVLVDGFWHHSRCDKEIAAYKAKAERNREVGKLGGRPKKNPQETMVVISGNPEETLTKNQEPRTINQEPEIQENGDYPISPIDPPISDGRCGLDEVVDLYHEMLPSLPSVRMRDKKRRTALAARQKDYPKAREIEWWQAFFAAAGESKFLMGETSTWNADFDFLTSPKGFKGVIEGKYK